MKGAARWQHGQLLRRKGDPQVPDGHAGGTPGHVVVDPPLAVAPDAAQQTDSFPLQELRRHSRTFSLGA